MTEPAPEEEPELTFLPAPAACGNEFEQVDWVGSVTVRLSDRVATGVRFNDEQALAVTREALGDRVLDVEAPPYFSVKIGTPGRRHRFPMHYLYLGSRPAVGSRSLERLFEGMGAHLSVGMDESPSTYTLYAEPLLTDRGVLLVPAEIHQMATATDRILDFERFVFPGIPLVRIERGSREITVPEPTIALTVDPTALARIGPSVTQPTLRPGRYPLAGVLLGVGAGAAGPLDPAAALFHAVRLLSKPLPFGAQSALEDMASLLDGVPVSGVSWSADDELVSAVRSAVEA